MTFKSCYNFSKSNWKQPKSFSLKGFSVLLQNFIVLPDLIPGLNGYGRKKNMLQKINLNLMLHLMQPNLIFFWKNCILLSLKFFESYLGTFSKYPFFVVKFPRKFQGYWSIVVKLKQGWHWVWKSGWASKVLRHYEKAKLSH